MIQFAHCSENVTQLGTMGESICEKRHDEIASFRHLVDFRFFTRWKKFLRTLCYFGYFIVGITEKYKFCMQNNFFFANFRTKNYRVIFFLTPSVYIHSYIHMRILHYAVCICKNITKKSSSLKTTF